ncbi:MAG: FtsX-like permease family protein, partial [Bacteroidota bacterium]
INVFTMLLLKRVREVGIRKVIGSSKSDLFAQLLAESIFVSLIGFTGGLVLASLCLPFYGRLTSIELSLQEVMVAGYLVPFIAMAVCTGIVAGAYPAYLAVSHYWNGKGNGDDRISLLRHGLVTFQFALCLCILTGAMVVYQQLSFIQNRELGYNMDQLVAVTPYGKLREALIERRDILLTELEATAGVSSVAFVTNRVGESLSMESFHLASDGIDGPDDDHTVNMIWADEYYLETMGIRLVTGRNFSPATDSSKTFIVNQKLADRLGGDVVGKRILWQNRSGVIVGVMADYHHYSLHKKIWPTAIAYTPDWLSHLMVRLEGTDPLGTLQAFESKLMEAAPGAMVRSTFTDDRVEQMYREENSMLRIAGVFALMAIIISAVGLLGLASLEITRRTKEVGVRKVLGASIRQTITLLGQQFIWVILLSIAISTPLNYWLADSWLSGFVFQTSLGWWFFALPALSVALLAGLIVIIQALKLAHANPVESLRYE